MDNNFDNNFGGQPQRPFTEKPGEQPPQQFDFNPEKPLMQQPEQPGQNAEQGYNPINQTAVYQDGAFNPINQTTQPEVQDNPQQNFGVQPPFNAQKTDYSNPVYYNNAYNRGNQQFYGRPPQQQPPQPPVQQPYTPAQPQYVSPLQGEAPQPNNQNPYIKQQMPAGQGYYNVPNQQKPKGNKGLIAVIIILAVMLVAAFAGIFIYVMTNQKGNTSGEISQNGNSNNFQIPNFENPGMVQPATEAPVFKDSDYSDKIQKDYKGLTVEQKPADAATNKSYNAEYAFQKASPSVVGIKGFSDSNKTIKNSEGSGIVISEDGYVITNAHVIANSKTSMTLSVYTYDGKEYNAGVVGFDSRTDIALLKLDDAKGLTPAVFGDSDKLGQGDDIVVVGNPGGMEFQNSMTKGIVSALERDASKKSIVKYIQTDAAINPGNSGGPAVNLYGQVIGMATAKIVDESYEGMGFCIPSATVKTIVDSLMKNGYVENRVKIGISGAALSTEEASALGVKGGILVQTVDPNGPCGKVLETGDIIYEADGKSISSFSEIYNVLENHGDGDKITIKYYRAESNSTGKLTEKEAEIELVADKGQ